MKNILPDYPWLHCRSLTVSLLLVPAGWGIVVLPLMSLGKQVNWLPAFIGILYGFVFSFAWLVGLLNLIRDAERPYAPWKVQIASLMFLIAAIVPGVILFLLIFVR